MNTVLHHMDILTFSSKQGPIFIEFLLFCIRLYSKIHSFYVKVNILLQMELQTRTTFVQSSISLPKTIKCSSKHFLLSSLNSQTTPSMRKYNFCQKWSYRQEPLERKSCTKVGGAHQNF